jgi:methylenetetrahydrofolate reductase (NADPH)
LGVNNLLVLQGDKGKLEPGWIPEDQSNKYAIDLQHQINDFNHGKFEDGTLMDNEPDIPFSYGVAGYPEKHFEAKTLEEDIQHLKDKVDAGADYVVTQMFFDNKKYFKFVEMCRMKGINVPIIPGIKPLISKKQQTVIPQVFALQFPEELNNALTACKTDDDVKQVGVEWSINQCRELMRSGVPSLHFYTQNAVDSVVKIAREIY